MRFRCEGCAIWCEISWQDDTSCFKPMICIAQFNNLVPEWKEVDEDGNTRGSYE